MKHVKMSASQGGQNTTVLKYSGAVPYFGKHTDKVMKTFNKLDVKIGMSNKATIVKKIINDQIKKRVKADHGGTFKITCGQCDNIHKGGNWYEVQHSDERIREFQSKTG